MGLLPEEVGVEDMAFGESDRSREGWKEKRERGSVSFTVWACHRYS
jgi:hypothetical protein